MTHDKRVDVHLCRQKSRAEKCGSELEYSRAEHIGDYSSHCGNFFVLLTVVAEFNERNKRAQVQ